MSVPAPVLLALPAGRAARLLALRWLEEAAQARVRLETPGDPAGLHDFRVALRRLRSTLRAYRPHLEESVRRKDRRRLRGLASATGASRDAEVQAAGMEALLDRFGGERRAGVEWMLARLRERRERADRELHREVAAEFDRERKRLGKRLRSYRVDVDPADPRGGPLCAEVVRGAMGEMAEELRMHLEAVRSVEDQEEAHRARIAAKRLRYLLEPFAEGAEGLPALLKRFRALQDVLGEMHDAQVLRDEVARALPEVGEGEDPDPRPGLRALAEWAGEERARIFAEVEAQWLSGGTIGLFQEIRGVGRKLGGGSPEDTEIERKYLLRRFPDLEGVAHEEIDQGWIPGERLAERVRRVRSGREERWYRTVKLGRGVRRVEVEEETPAELAKALWRLTRGKRVRKLRYRVPDGDLVWEIDRFRRRGLVLAEVELPSEDTPVEFPEWLRPYVVREVTGEPEYLNLNLAG